MFESNSGNNRLHPQTVMHSVALRVALEQPSGITIIARQLNDLAWRGAFYIRRCVWFLSHLVSLALVAPTGDEDAVSV